MAATTLDLSQWFDRGVADGARYMIVAVDEFDHSNYPAYVDDPHELTAEINRITGSPMQGVMEVYDLRADKAAQLLEVRAWNVPA